MNQHQHDLGPDPLANFTNEDRLFAKVLQPYVYAELVRFYQEGKFFAYYTSSETAYNILKNNEIWLRKTGVMNDFREIEYGFGLLRKSVEKNKQRLEGILNKIAPDLFSNLLAQFDNWLPSTLNGTFISCFSEHNPNKALLNEDLNGRLSMWRAYGKSSGIAFIMKNGPFLRPTSALNSFTSPVAYLNEEEFDAKFVSWLDGVEEHIDIFQKLSSENMVAHLHRVFVFVIVGTKHPGFMEEREWRIIHTPIFGKPNKLKLAVESISGLPQLVYKLPLENVPDEKLFGVTIPELIEKIIVGPTQHPQEVKAAMIELLAFRGVSNPAARVTVSEIPLR